MDNTKGLTPKIISTDYSNEYYKIPIYQRLFEWDSEKIEQLLNDLYSTYQKDCHEEPYYVGMLTSTGEDNNLVDGQQRFTVMTLLGIVMRTYYKEWDNFISISENNEKFSRLVFSARPDDQNYLNSILLGLKDDKVVINNKMAKGQECILSWLIQKRDDESSSLDLGDFSKYVYEHLTFFISCLPKDYKGRDLNKYFESMNSTGRNLESHEIQKIHCLKEISGSSILSEENATKIWNVVSQMDKPLIRKITENKITERDEILHKRYDDTLLSLQKGLEVLKNFDFSVLNDYRKNTFENTDERSKKSIKEIPIAINKDAKPSKHIRNGSYHGMLSFSEFLLQVLYIQKEYTVYSPTSDVVVNDFFDVQKLLETFKKETAGWNQNEWVLFFYNLLKYRLLFDYYVILIPNEEDVAFDLEYADSTEEDTKDKQKLRQYQAMLYAGSASKSFYLWMNPYMLELSKIYQEGRRPTCKELVSALKKRDNERYPNSSHFISELTYQNSPLYWFRRLDYYLWERNLESENPDELISKYRFRRGGRSIEHLYPQDGSEQIKKWNNINNVHRFGNLCLISSSFNSTQSNDSLTVKIARVEDQKVRQQLESIKLYEMYKEYIKAGKEWSEKLMEQHEEKMFKILEDSYN